MRHILRTLARVVPRALLGATAGGLAGFAFALAVVFVCNAGDQRRNRTMDDALNDLNVALAIAMAAVILGATAGAVWAIRRGRRPQPPAQ